MRTIEGGNLWPSDKTLSKLSEALNKEERFKALTKKKYEKLTESVKDFREYVEEGKITFPNNVEQKYEGQ